MAGSISFHILEVELNFAKARKTKEWIMEIVQKENRSVESINYVFCSDEFLYSLNKAYLKHTTYTDILTFDYSIGKPLVGDIYISIDRVRENAGKLGIAFEEELRRVMIHGILHMAGYSDKTARQKAAMRKKEEACLSLFPK